MPCYPLSRCIPHQSVKKRSPLAAFRKLTEQRRIKAEQKDAIQTVTVKFTASSGSGRIHFTSSMSSEVLLLLLHGCGRAVDPIAGGGVTA
jgi:hypothetical protein